MNSKNASLELSIVMPCLNEEATVGSCVEQAKEFLARNKVNGEVIIADNGSQDKSVQIAEASGARVVNVAAKGYGAALRGGFAAAQGKYIIMGDADESYDFINLMPFLSKLRDGFDLVMGNRFRGGIAPGAMPWHHRYIGNPILSFVGRLFFKTPATDFHCGLRGFSKSALEEMNLQTTGMELASEIVVKASLLDMRVSEVPTTLSPDGRDRAPHLRSFRDGWRHLRFLMMYSPRWLFLYPGITFMLLGGILSAFLFFGPVDIGLRVIDFHSFIITGTAFLIGMNMVSFAIIARIYASKVDLIPDRSDTSSTFKIFNLERGMIVGGFFVLIGVVLGIWGIVLSQTVTFNSIGFGRSVRIIYGASLSLAAGIQTIITSFILSILGIKTSE